MTKEWTILLVYTGENHYHSVQTKGKQSSSGADIGDEVAELRGEIDEMGLGDAAVSRDD